MCLCNYTKNLVEPFTVTQPVYYEFQRENRISNNMLF